MEEMEYIKIPLHGKNGNGKYTLVDGDYDGEYFSQYRWYLLPNGYVGRAMVELPSKDRNGYIYLHREVCSPPTGYIVDHINRDKLDNRSCNLRWATYSDNANNRDNTNISDALKKRKGCQKNYIGSSGYRGVNKENHRGRTVYRLRFKQKYIGGMHDEPVGVARQYDVLAKQEWGDAALLNFPD